MTPAPMPTNAPATHRHLSLLAWGAILMVGLTALAVGRALVPTVRDLLTPGPKTASAAEQDFERRIGEFHEAASENLALAQGRSMFVVPPPPNAIAEADQPEPEAEVAEGPAPTPTRYGGPDPIAVINNAVWFSDSTDVPVGRERSGVEVVSVDNAPWTVRLRWREVEFDVEIFENTTQTFLQQNSESRGRP